MNSFKHFPGVQYGVTSKKDGNLALHVPDNPQKVIKRRKKFAKSLEVDFSKMTFMEQVHGSEVAVIDTKNAGSGRESHADSIRGVDAMITDKRGITLIVQVADCVPLLLYDKKQKVIGVVHAGWRGTVCNILGKTLQKMGERSKSYPRDIHIYIGPAIGPCCYHVGGDVLAQFQSNGFLPQEYPKDTVDLQAINKSQAIEAGVLEDHIEIMPICTSCKKDVFFSYRADGANTGRNSLAIVLTS